MTARPALTTNLTHFVAPVAFALAAAMGGCAFVNRRDNPGPEVV